MSILIIFIYKFLTFKVSKNRYRFRYSKLVHFLNTIKYITI